MEKNYSLNGNGARNSAVKNFNSTSSRRAATGIASTHSATKIEDTQWMKYKHKSGHGFAAEDVNAQIDRWHGRKVDCVGRNNAPNGADRIVNGQPIQTKYCQTANNTVKSAFDGQTGMYRYDGMKLEVPKDQYEECVRLMREAISQGKVAGVTDPDMASKIVVKGHVTYAQAQKVAKAGNWESIKFDMRTQAISCARAAVISGVIGFWNVKKQGLSNGEATKETAKAGADYAENLASNSASIEGGWGGASAGAAIGTAIFLGVGTIIGGGIGGGIGASSAMRKATIFF